MEILYSCYKIFLFFSVRNFRSDFINFSPGKIVAQPEKSFSMIFQKGKNFDLATETKEKQRIPEENHGTPGGGEPIGNLRKTKKR